jgi:DNA-binding beta-propeller fold protein YncE
LHTIFDIMNHIFSLFALTLLISSCSYRAQTHSSEMMQYQTVVLDITAFDSLENEQKTFQSLRLIRTIQAYDISQKSDVLVYDSAINSPKSAVFCKDGSKFYIHSLEGHTTIVYDTKSLEKLKEIQHVFNENSAHFFKDGETTIFEYPYKQTQDNFNHFMGKPVESCLSHEGKYLWVTYYRRDFDPSASSPSAVAIIDTETDEIVRVMPCGPLPKMIACSPDNKRIAVTHWGDNTVAIIDIDSDDVFDFHYTEHIYIDGKLVTNFAANVDRDNNCGNCLRGTLFTPDGRFLLIAKMGGNGIAVVRTSDMKYIGTLTGSKLNLRHIIVEHDFLYVSSNKFGYVQRMPLEFLDSIKPDENNALLFHYAAWKSTSVGIGARTIEMTPDGRYILVCVNNESKIAVIDAEKMSMIYSLPVSKFPVGLAISPDGKYAVVTSQGKASVAASGNAVNVYEIVYE